jgi:LAS superfamily LD-carboxypeptidase LdcB
VEAPDIFLRPDMAANYLALRRAAKKAGVPLIAREGYRDWAAQAAADARHGPGLAAPPGHSWHGAGLAVDLGNYDYDWVAQNAGRFGLYQPMSYEPWHWQLRTAESGGYSSGEDAPTYYSNPARRRIRRERAQRRRRYIPYAHTREKPR